MSLLRNEQVDQELNEELGTYQEMAAEEKMQDGMSRKDALRAVRLERGSLELTKEVVRSGGWESFVETCLLDLRVARIHGCRRSDSRLRYRREHGHFQRAERHNLSPPRVRKP